MAQPYQSLEHAWVEGEVESFDLPIKGSLPKALHGMFARNSANPRYKPEGRYHWFDGDGMIHGVHLVEGRASYRNKYIHTKAFLAEQEADKALWRGILEPVDMSNPHGPMKDTANTDLVWHRQRLLALWWLSGKPYEVSVPELETIGACEFSLPRTMAAHAKVDPNTDELMFFDFSLIKKPYYGYGVINSEGELTNYAPVDLPYPSIPHDIAITKNYTILLDLPLGWDFKALKQGKRRIAFHRQNPARFGLIPRHGQSDQIQWFEADPCYVYHTITAFEKDDIVELVACRIADPIPEKPSPGTVTKLDTIELIPQLYRWRFNRTTGEVREEALDDRLTEFPRINDRMQSQQARYSYNPSMAPEQDLKFNGFIKYDLQTGDSQQVSYPNGTYGGEVVFAPNPEGQAEDDGWVLSLVTNGQEDTSELVLWHGETLEEVARITMPRRVPLGFHAEWADLSTR